MFKLSFSDSYGLSLSLLKKILVSQFVFLILMSIFRIIFFYEFSSNEIYLFSDIKPAFIMGIRLDLVVLGYIQAPLSLILMLLYFLRSSKLFFASQKFTLYYLLFFYLIASSLIAADFGYFSFFNEHITLMIYGILDDDTQALWNTMKSNYSIVGIVSSQLVYLLFIYIFLNTIFKSKLNSKQVHTKVQLQLIFFILLISINLIIIRGTFGMQPLAKVIPDISENTFVNELPNNGVLAFIKASKLYKKSKSGQYDLIKKTQYNGKVNEAFSYLGQKEVQKDSYYPEAITYTVAKNEKIDALKPHVVVVMVESFGLPIVKHQSQDFNILGRLEKHFKEDAVFTNFISASNGTIVSLEPLLLNITARPESTSIGQSEYQYTSFPYAAAKVYEKAGYETRFVYGGDLKWRNIGKFMSKQGFNHQSGKINIASSLNINLEDSSHDWGVFDQYAYDYVLKTLKEAKKPQFIFLLTTNNHPPFTVPKEYQAASLKCSSDLRNCMIGDQELIQKRLKDYQYAVDMAGRFMDGIKDSDLAKKSIVAITADNNTIEGRIRYSDTITESKKIPFYLYVPKSIKIDVDTATPGSHKDIFPTLYHQSLSNVEYTSVGKNLFDTAVRHCGFNDAGIIISKDGAFKYKKATNESQKECEKEYGAALSVSDWLIRINPQNNK